MTVVQALVAREWHAVANFAVPAVLRLRQRACDLRRHMVAPTGFEPATHG